MGGRKEHETTAVTDILPQIPLSNIAEIYNVKRKLTHPEIPPTKPTNAGQQ